MGFRRPVTSATDVNTSTGTAVAGVRVYEVTNPDTGAPAGVVEFDDGIPGNLPAQIIQTAVAVPRSEVVGRLALDGGSYQAGTFGLIAAPELDLSVESYGTSGNPTGVARLTTGVFLVNGEQYPPQRIPRAWQFNRVSANASDSLPNGAFTTVASGTITNAPAGDYLIGFRSTASNTVATAGFTTVTVNGNDIGDGQPRADCFVAGQRIPFFESVTFTHTGGNLTARGLYEPVAGAGTCSIWTQGTQLSVVYLGPRT